jgi:hypothetical protein
VRDHGECGDRIEWRYELGLRNLVCLAARVERSEDSSGKGTRQEVLDKSLHWLADLPQSGNRVQLDIDKIMEIKEFPRALYSINNLDICTTK